MGPRTCDNIYGRKRAAGDGRGAVVAAGPSGFLRTGTQTQTQTLSEDSRLGCRFTGTRQPRTDAHQVPTSSTKRLREVPNNGRETGPGRHVGRGRSCGGQTGRLEERLLRSGESWCAVNDGGEPPPSRHCHGCVRVHSSWLPQEKLCSALFSWSCWCGLSVPTD